MPEQNKHSGEWDKKIAKTVIKIEEMTIIYIFYFFIMW